MAGPVVLINAFEVPAGEAEQFIAAWEQSRDFMRAQPGFIETALHQALMPDADFLFVNVARWETAADFTAAVRSAGFLESAAALASYRPHPGLYRVIRT
ncbi:MAG: antibiotic biosynthesis monooxygenase family protein [Trebonia sp.]